jgi:formimidoylglutamate deiminase
MTSTRLFARDALLPGGWASDVLIEWNADGTLTGVSPQSRSDQASGVPRAAGPVLPGLPNLHSHAFQRAFAGLAEFRATHDDSFWSWRERMYAFANAITPEQLEAVATWLFVEMLEGGYTAVCEFHYLHHAADGRPYADAATLAAVVAAAAARTGIGLTMLPVLYQQGGFGAAPPQEGQRRFVQSTEALLALVSALSSDATIPRVGLALHSLRAVSAEALRDAVQGMASIDRTAPIHVHAAEQIREVEDCLAWSGQRPVEWLLDHVPVNVRWCLVHATHMTPEEAKRAAATGAVAGLCPSTEANLGDGVFDIDAWWRGEGRWGVGSDSHVSVNAADELRLLEYSQRLRLQRRNIISTVVHPNVATMLTLGAVTGGAAASGRPIGGLAPGQRADLVVLDAAHPAIAGLPAPEALDAHVFAASRRSTIDTVVAGGRTVVAQGRHPLRDEAAAAFVRARADLLETPGTGA